MFGRRMKLFKLLGFEVRVDLSWTIIAILVVWSLSVGLFPYWFAGLSRETYWWMGIAGALGLFASIVVHEFSHSLVANRLGIPMKGITLFIFGGVAEMGDEPPSPRSEFLMSIAGPICSILLAGGFFWLFKMGVWSSMPVAFSGTAAYLAYMNLILAGFNLLPAFPLDGGRILRSILWRFKQDLLWATRIASYMGSGFGIFLILAGVFYVFGGNFIGGMWWFLIGMFLMGAAKASYKQVLTRKALEGEHVRRFMKEDPVTVNPSISVQRLLEEYVYRYHYKLFPVVEDTSRLVGCVTTKEIKDVAPEERNQKCVGDIAVPCTPENSISAEADAMQALALMNRTDASGLLVVDEGRLEGVTSLKDLLGFLSLKMELEGSPVLKKRASW